jgi:hypothetical protein
MLLYQKNRKQWEKVLKIPLGSRKSRHSGSTKGKGGSDVNDVAIAA